MRLALYAQSTYVVKVIAVYMRIYAEQPTDDRAHRVSEILGEGYACTMPVSVVLAGVVQMKKDRFYWGKHSHHQGGSGPSSSMHLRIPEQAA